MKQHMIHDHPKLERNLGLALSHVIVDREPYERVQVQHEQLQAVLMAAKVALDTCRDSMKPLVRDGVHALSTQAASEQFTAAWRDLKNAVREAKEGE